jgi:hypothetical protein
MLKCDNAENCQELRCSHLIPHELDDDYDCTRHRRCAAKGVITICKPDDPKRELSAHLDIPDAEELIRKAKEQGYKNIDEIVAFAYEAGYDDAEKEKRN